MKKYFSVAAWYDDYDTMPDIYIVLAASKEKAVEEVKKLYDDKDLEMDIAVNKEIDLSLPTQKIFPCWWDHISDCGHEG